jgi:hypothetical protein
MHRKRPCEPIPGQSEITKQSQILTNDADSRALSAAISSDFALYNKILAVAVSRLAGASARGRMEPGSRVTVVRKSPEDGQYRQVNVTLDDKPFATLMYDRIASLPVAPGHHTLRVDNTWNKQTVEFDLAPDEHIQFRTINRLGRFTWFLVAIIGVGPMYVSVEREPVPNLAEHGVSDGEDSN